MTAREVLDGIKDRLTKATPGPWFREYGDVISNQPDPRDVEDGYEDPRNARVVKSAPHLNRRDRQAIADATFIAAAPVDVARLTRAVEQALGEHQPIPCDPECCDGQLCSTCIHDWPCSTVAAIEDALNPKEGQ